MARTLNLGVLAHVDAGKTSLTERLLFDAGVIDEVGSVDRGNTQTDTMALERRRGITIRSAVVSFALDDLAVNLVDTPGHPDFIAEVERVLGVLDGAVLVISAVEGVQAQTRVLMRALRRLHLPTLLFVNKIDRGGAGYGAVLRAIGQKLTPAMVAMGSASGLGTREARFTPYTGADAGFTSRLIDLLAEHDDALLAAYVQDERAVPYRRLRAALAAQTRRALVHPVFFGSAITGAGVADLTAGIRELLPAAGGTAGAPASGTVFKVERGPAGEKVGYVRMLSGTLRVRERVRYGPDREGKITAIGVFERGGARPAATVVAGQIGTLRGLDGVRIGDRVGAVDAPAAGPVTGPRAAPATGPRARGHHFAPPTLETVVIPARPADRGLLHAALAQLAEQDPLISLRRDDIRQEISVSLYGEVQKEVIQATLASDYHLEVSFGDTTTVCVERPAGTGAAVEFLGAAGNPFLATVGMRVRPAPAGAGVRFRLAVPHRSIPLYVYRSVDEFRDAVEATVRDTLRQGRHGWQVTDCVVTMTHSDYQAPGTSAGDVRKLTPLVLMSALAEAGTVVCEPVHRFRLDGPADTLTATLRVLARLGAVPHPPATHGSSYLLDGEIPAARMHELQQALRGPTRGEGVIEFSFDRYEPVRGPVPSRPRTDANPFDRKEYLLHVRRRM